NRIPPELPLNRREIIPQQFEYFFPVDNRWRAQWISLIGAVIRELHINPKILLLQQSHNLLQSIAVLSAHPNQIALDRSLHLLLRILDQLHDFARLLDRDPLLHGNPLLGYAAQSGLNRAIGEAFQRHSTLHQPLLKYI